MLIHSQLSRRMGKPTICIGENKGADQLRSNCEADQRLCFRYTDSTFPPLLIPKFSRFWVSSVTVQAGLCRTWSEPKLLVFSRTGSIVFTGALSQTTDSEIPTCQPDSCPPTATCKEDNGYIYCDCPPGKVGEYTHMSRRI